MRTLPLLCFATLATSILGDRNAATIDSAGNIHLLATNDIEGEEMIDYGDIATFAPFPENEYFEDEDMEEEAEDEDLEPPSSPVDLRILNKCKAAGKADLLWRGPTGEMFTITSLKYNVQAAVNTYAGTPFVISSEADEYLAFTQFTVDVIKSQMELTLRCREDEKALLAKKPAVEPMKGLVGSRAATFRNLVPGISRLLMWYDDGADGSYSGSASFGELINSNSYIGHTFYFTDEQHKRIGRPFKVTADPDNWFYVTDDRYPLSAKQKEEWDHEVAFRKEYAEKNGRPWMQFFNYTSSTPRPPPQHHMWPADYVGQIHQIETAATHWVCQDTKSDKCHQEGSLSLELEVISTSPRAYIIRNLLSKEETSHIISTAKPKIAQSLVGSGTDAHTSSTRTSTNTWLARSTSPIIDTIFARVESVLQIPRLDYRNTESIQVVNYRHAQRYDAHHDWSPGNEIPSRFSTLLLYLNDQEAMQAGGETTFPKAGGKDGNPGNGIRVHPGAGNAVLFYNLLPDGNGDDLSLHSALPVLIGEKWLANFWVWDPLMSTRDDA